MVIHIRQAKQNELRFALEMLRDAAAWLNSLSVNYWQDWLKPTAPYVAWIQQGFDNDVFYFAENESGEVVGMFRLQYADELFWGKRDDKAAYIHSFTTNRKYKNQGVGREILRQIEEKLTGEGIEFLRLDCSPHVEKLCAYYESYGFLPKETVTIFGEELRLYEKRLLF